MTMARSHGSPTGAMILVLLTLAVLLQPSAACITEERNVLLSFKAGITADPQGLLSNWTATGDCCTWGGSFCDSTGYITQITILPNPEENTGYYLNGTISPALGNLSHLKVLDLSNLKHLSGPLPASLGSLNELEYFSVRGNNLNGTIPANYGDLTNLTQLDVGENWLLGDIPSTLGGIGPQLRSLDLGSNRLSGAIPPLLYNLTGLVLLYANDNALTGAISPAIGQLQSLYNLDFSYNNLTGPIPAEIGSLTSALHLDLSGNALTGAIPAEVGALSSLQFLSLSRNSLTGSIPTEIGGLTYLSSLTLDKNNLTGVIPPMLTGLKLIVLDLSNNQLTGDIPPGAPFSTFPASAFAGNAGLCNAPLPPCSSR